MSYVRLNLCLKRTRETQREREKKITGKGRGSLWE